MPLKGPNKARGPLRSSLQFEPRAHGDEDDVVLLILPLEYQNQDMTNDLWCYRSLVDNSYTVSSSALTCGSSQKPKRSHSRKLIGAMEGVILPDKNMPGRWGPQMHHLIATKMIMTDSNRKKVPP